MQILLTGAAGSLGSRVLTRLAAAGHSVLSLGLHAPPRAKDCTHLNADPRDRAAVEKALHPHRDIRVLVDLGLAGAPHEADGRGAEDTAMLVELLPQSVAQVVFASSVDVYGPPQYFPVTEAHPLEPSTPGARARSDSEEFLNAECRERGIKICILRLAETYGPGTGGANPVRTLLAGILGGAAPVLEGDGSDMREYLHVDDAAQAFELAVAKRAEGIYTISSGEPLPLSEITGMALRLSGSPLAPVRAERRTPRTDIGFSILTARRHLGFQPGVTLEEGMRGEIAAIRGSPAR